MPAGERGAFAPNLIEHPRQIHVGPLRYNYSQYGYVALLLEAADLFGNNRAGEQRPPGRIALLETINPLSLSCSVCPRRAALTCGPSGRRHCARLQSISPTSIMSSSRGYRRTSTGRWRWCATMGATSPSTSTASRQRRVGSCLGGPSRERHNRPICHSSSTASYPSSTNVPALQEASKGHLDRFAPSVERHKPLLFGTAP